MMYTREERKDTFKTTLKKINKIVFYYLWGRAQVMILLAIMYYIVFLLFGLPYAVLLTIFGSLITIIPYFGPFISGLLPILFSFIFFDKIEKTLNSAGFKPIGYLFGNSSEEKNKPEKQ